MFHDRKKNKMFISQNNWKHLSPKRPKHYTLGIDKERQQHFDHVSHQQHLKAKRYYLYLNEHLQGDN